MNYFSLVFCNRPYTPRPHPSPWAPHEAQRAAVECRPVALGGRYYAVRVAAVSVVVGLCRERDREEEDERGAGQEEAQVADLNRLRRRTCSRQTQ